jgi:hypothetical protein
MTTGGASVKTTYEDLATLRFDGDRFSDHALDVDVTQELIAYKRLVLECAKELWRRRHPDRVRLPRGFEEGFSLTFSEIRRGSAAVPLKRRIDRADGDLDLPLEDEFADAARAIDGAIRAASTGGLLPAELPRNIIPLFANFGRSLRADESITVRAVGQTKGVRYTDAVRERLANWREPTYEDTVELLGEVSMASVKGQFTLTLDGGEQITGRFEPAHEALVLEALFRHREVKFRVKGIAEFNETDRTLRAILHVDRVEIVSAAATAYDESARPIWEVISGIGAQAPPGTWDSVPEDLSMRVDEYLAGDPDDRP